MASESERALMECGSQIFYDTDDGVRSSTCHKPEYHPELHKYEPDTNPKEPTLTCSEVVERLRDECINGAFNAYLAEKILHSWRERRVQELEEALRLAGIRIGKCAGRMRGCNEHNRENEQIAEYHELVAEVDDWQKEAERVLNSEWREQIRKGAKHE